MKHAAATGQPRVPIPPARRLWLLRRQALPAAVFVALIAAIVVLWREHVVPVEMVGEAIAPRAVVLAPQAGRIVSMQARQHARVRLGDTLAVVMTTDPALLEAQLAVIRAEVDVLRHSLDPLVGRRRADLDHERLRLELMDQRVVLAAAEVRQVHAENQLVRARQLHEDGLLAIADLETATADRDALATEVTGRRQVVATLRDELARLQLPPLESAEAPLRAAISLHEQRLRVVEAELAPITLRAPLDGVVGVVLRGAGEHVVAGELLLTVLAETSDQIQAYLRQPLKVEPQVGMAVRIRVPARGKGGGTVGYGEVVSVAAQLELLPEDMLGPAGRPEKALPLLISVPEGLPVKPGERLELALLP